MYNLYKEISNLLARYNKRWSDVKWIGTDTYYMDCNNFFKQIANQDTPNKFGVFENDHTLYIVGKNWWLEREKDLFYYYSLPQKPSLKINFLK